MPIPARDQLCSEGVVPVLDFVRLDKAAVYVSVYGFALLDARREHVHLDVLTQQMLPTQEFRGDVPHTHVSPPPEPPPRDDACV
jgi:hypothetical protein